MLKCWLKCEIYLYFIAAPCCPCWTPGHFEMPLIPTVMFSKQTTDFWDWLSKERYTNTQEWLPTGLISSSWECFTSWCWRQASGHPGRQNGRSWNAQGDPVKSQWSEGATWTFGSASSQWQVEKSDVKSVWKSKQNTAAMSVATYMTLFFSFVLPTKLTFQWSMFCSHVGWRRLHHGLCWNGL